MSGRKGMVHYSEEIKEKIRMEWKKGASIRGLSRKYGMSVYAISSWCGLRSEVNLRHSCPLPRGRKPKNRTCLEQEMKRLRMENELLRDFLKEFGRR